MALIVTCTCGKRLKAPDTAAGKRVRCPECKKVLVVPTPDPPAGERVLEIVDEEEQEAAEACPSCGAALAPGAVLCVQCGYNLSTGEHVGAAAPARRAKRKKVSKKAWRTVRIGLTLVYAAVVTVVAVVLGVVVAVLAAITGAPAGLLVAGAVLAVVALFIAWILQLVGQCMCAAAPPSEGARGFIIAALACTAVSFVLGLVDGAQRGFAGPAGQPAPATALSALGSLLGLASTFLFLLFLRAVALSFRFHELAASVIRYILVLIGFPVFVIGSALLLPLLAVAIPHGGLLRNAVGLGFFLVFIAYVIILIVWYIRLIRETRDAIPA